MSFSSKNRTHEGRLGIGIISAGKVGAVLGAALRQLDHAVVGVSAVSEESRNRAETLLPNVPILEIPEIIERSELVLLAVPDDALAELVRGLATIGAWLPGQIVAHTSGRFGVGVLSPIRAAGAIPLAIHPAMTFTGMSLDLARLQDCVFGVSADTAMLPIAQALVVEMGAEPVVIAEGDRALYHGALAHSANHLATLTAQSAQILAEIGVESPQRMLSPLLRASLENALSSGESALTGPVVRGDVETLAAHISALKDIDSTSQGESSQDSSRSPRKTFGPVLPSYRAMAIATAYRAHARGLLKDQQLLSVLAALEGIEIAE